MSGDFSQQQWSVNVTDDDTRNLTPPEIGQLYAAGQLDLADTYVWRDGMDDWLPLGQCADLQPYLGGGGGASAAPPAAAAAPAAHAFEGTQMMESPVQQPEPEPVSESYSSLANAASAPIDDDRRVGQRNEESALFSLDDIRAAAASTSKKPAAPAADDPFGDLMNLGAVGGGGIAAAFAPPPINAPPPPEPKPEPKPAPVAAAAPAASPAQATPSVVPLQASGFPPPAPEKKGKGMIIGIAVAALLAVAAGVFFFASSSDEPTAKNETKQSDGDKSDKGDSDKGDKSDKGDSDKGDSDDKSDGDDGDKTASTDGDDKKDDAKDDDKKDVKSSAGSKSGTTAKAGSKATQPKSGTKKDDKKDDKKEPVAKKDDKKDDPPKAAAEFNVNAARSALSSAAGAASGCKRADGPTGKGRVTVTFAPSGRATQALVGPPFAGTSVGSCAAAAFRRASVPPFTGSPMSVSKSFYIR